MSDSLPTVTNPWIAGLLDAFAKPPADPLAVPTIGGLPTPGELETAELWDDLARMEDEAAAERGEPGAGGDIIGRASPRILIRPSNAEPDPLAVMRSDLPVVRTGRRYFGAEWAQPRAIDPEASSLPLPKDAPRVDPVSGQAWRRGTLPTEGWGCLGLRLSDGVEGCSYCARGLRARSRLAVLWHFGNDVMLSTCLDCADSLCGRPVADRNEDETPIPFRFPPIAASLRDPSLWKGDPDSGRMTLDLSEGFQIRLSKAGRGISVEIDFPDLAGETTVVGTYTDFGGALSAAYLEIQEWEKR